jgi:hypothetical protein
MRWNTRWILHSCILNGCDSAPQDPSGGQYPKTDKPLPFSPSDKITCVFFSSPLLRSWLVDFFFLACSRASAFLSLEVRSALVECLDCLKYLIMSVHEIADPNYTGSEKNPNNRSAPVNDQTNLLGQGSPGVRRIEIINANFTLVDRVCLFLSIFLIAYVYGLDGTVRYTYQVHPGFMNPQYIRHEANNIVFE